MQQLSYQSIDNEDKPKLNVKFITNLKKLTILKKANATQLSYQLEIRKKLS